MSESKSKTRSIIQTDEDTLYYERCERIDVHKNLLVLDLPYKSIFTEIVTIGERKNEG